MTVLSLPSHKKYRSGRWRMIDNAARFTSPISRVAQSVGRPGTYWACSIELPESMDLTVAADWASLLAQLAGGKASVYVPPPMRNISTVAGTPRIKGAGQSGMTLALDGFTPGDVIQNGQFLSYDTATFRALHIAVATVVADGAGEMSLPVRGPTRREPPDNAIINLSSPTCEMVLEGSDVDLLNLTDAALFGHTLSFIEDVRA